MRKVGVVLATLFALVLLAVGLGFWYLRSSGADYDGERELRGLRENVEVWRDTLGVPHIWGSSLEDVLFAQGFVHAEERLWQMEMLRRVAEGRLAEALGESLLETDRFFRTIGLWRAAEVAERALDPQTRSLLDAYVAGVNEFLATRSGTLPPEFLMLRIEPEPWTARHSLAVEKIMGFDLSAYHTGIDLSRALRQLGQERGAILVPDYPTWGPTIVSMTEVPAPPPLALELLDGMSIRRASNAWVIGGQRTRSGKPILANDMHLMLRAPSLWKLMALHGGGVDVVGMSIPGVPLIVAGHNRAIAWGYTNAMVDDVDFFVERIDPRDSTRYLTPGGSEPFRVIEERVGVKGRDSAEILRVRQTRHGPILAGLEERLGKEPVAMRWIAHDPAGTFRAIAGFNRATNWQDFVKAVEEFDNPHQNVVYADTAGHIGYYMGGRVPLRGASRKRPPLLPVPGWTGEWDWTGDLPFSEHPHVLDPPEGFVVTANNRQMAGAVGDLVSAEWEEPFRAARIRELVEGAAPRSLDAAAVHAQQLDVGDARAARYRAHAVAAAEKAGLHDAAGLLRDWDLRATADSRAAAVFYVWIQKLGREAATSLYGNRKGWFPRWSLHRVLEARSLPWEGTKGGAAFVEAAEKAMRDAAAAVGNRTWGEVHQVVVEHPLGSVAAVQRLLKLNIGPEAIGGSPTTVNVAHYAGEDLPLITRYGASQRHVVDMADVDASGGFIIPTGESGLPFSDHYKDQFERWRRGGLWLIPLERSAAEKRIVHRMRLKPGRGTK